MWDRQYWYVAHQSFRDQRRASRQAYRATRRSYRYRRGRAPFFVILCVILIASAVSHGSIFMLIPFLIVGSILFMVLRSIVQRSSGSFGSDSNYQQPNQYYQPSQQPNQYYQPPEQPNQYYQPPASPQPATTYQPYEQGYQAPQNEYQPDAQPYQGNPVPSSSEQYEEPQAQYPQEMPPMM